MVNYYCRWKSKKLMPVTIGLLVTFVTIFLLVMGSILPPAASARGRQERTQDQGTDSTMSQMPSDVSVVNDAPLEKDALVRARGQIGVYGNEPFTFYAIRTEIAPEILRDAGHLRHDGSEYDTDEPVPWLLELEAPDRIRLNDWQGQTVVVTGYLRRLPAGPRHGLLEVRSIEAAP